MTGAGPPLILHATCVAAHGRGLLITGRSGSGKSALALWMMALGARLVADDRTCLARDGGQVTASAPAAIAGLIEARGIGLLRTDPVAAVALAAVVDLDRRETDRLPAPRVTRILDRELPLLFRVDAPHFPPALMQFLKSGRQEDEG